MARARFVGFFCLISAAPCLAWGPDGHRIVGDIASQYLSPAAMETIADLLDGKTPADVSNWADEIKSDSGWDWAYPLHYANVEPGADGFVMGRDCPPKGCVVKAILDFSEVLGDANADRTKRVEALKFLVHFVADIHQPLHVSHARDRGGNDIKVTFFDDRTNLHEVWDVSLIEHSGKQWNLLAAELMMTRITPERQAEWTRTDDPNTWATESYKAAVTHAYAIPESRELGADYFERCMPVVEERLTMAGVRLAALLNRLLDRPADADVSGEQ